MTDESDLKPNESRETPLDATRIKFKQRLRKRRKTTTSDKNITSDSLRQQNVVFGKLILQDLNHFLNINEVEDDEEEKNNVDIEMEQLMNMLRLPLCLEKFMLLGFLAAFDCFLYYFTLLPIRLIYGLKTYVSDGFSRRQSRIRKERFITFLILIASIFLSYLDTSKIYHTIKMQSAVKLYMLYGFLDMADKMLASLGQSLFTVVLSQQYQDCSTIHQSLCIILTIGYLVAHGYVLIYQTVSLNVAVNSYSNSLLSLLLSVQFSEIKSAVFKKFEKEGLFQITIADVVERFQIIVYLMIITIRNLAAKSIPSLTPNSWTLSTTSSVVIGVLCGPILKVLGSELLVDWAKHAYIIKFNRVKPGIYDKFFYIIYKDYVSGLQKYQDRLGLPLPALSVLTIALVRPTLAQMLNPLSSITYGISLFILGFMMLVLFKFILHMVLLKWGRKIRADILQKNLNSTVTECDYEPGVISSGIGKIDEKTLKILNTEFEGNFGNSQFKNKIPNSPFKLTKSPVETKQKSGTNPNSLENVSRYKMVSKKIW